MRRFFSALAGSALALGAASPVLWPRAADAQLERQLNPVYVDDSPVATETFSRVREHVAAGNRDEAARVLQLLLDEQPDRVAPVAGTDLYISVREGVHRTLLGSPELLARYRALQGPKAAGLLEQSGPGPVERSYQLTPAGLEAALRIAQAHLEDARFEAARLTLEQLESHPDRVEQAAKEAAELYERVAAFLNRPEVLERARRWRREASLPEQPPAPAREWPAAALDSGKSAIDPLPALETAGLIDKPLWTVALATRPAAPEELPDPIGSAAVPQLLRELLTLPTVSGDLVYINSGSTVMALDRFTLAQRWATSPSADEAAAAAPPDPRLRRFERLGYGFGGMPDARTVTVEGRYAAAATGRDLSESVQGDTRLTGLDAHTGRLRWTHEVSALDPTLEGAAVIGPVEISEGVVVAGLRKSAGERRLYSIALAGLDADTGRLLWTRPVGSAGWLPWMTQASGPDATAVAEGVAYRADRLGVVGAVEIATGRPVWVRRMPTESGGTPVLFSGWQLGAPVVHGDSLFIVSPDGKRLVRLDRRSGEITAERDAAAFNSPAYLLKAGDRLVAVSADRVSFVPLEGFATADVHATAPLGSPGIWGRASVAGDRVIMPTVTGFAIADVSRPGAERRVVRLENPGNVLALGSQLVVVDDARVHSYLRWDVAEALLTERIKADPKDAAPAVTYAELAYRALKHDRIVQAVDTALAAMGRSPEAAGAGAARQRLVETLQTMINASVEPDGAAPPPSRAQTGASPRIDDLKVVAALIERLRATARSPEERVAVAFATGRFAENAGRAPEAVAAYQSVLDEPALAQAAWRGPFLSVRGDLEASRRLESLIDRLGAGVYAAQEAAAREALAALGASPAPEALEGLAARFPLASIAPEVWSSLATAYEGAGQDRAALAALESGLRAADRVPAPSPAAVGELAGRLVVELQSRQQAVQAAGVLAAVRERHPGVTLTAGGVALDTERLGSDLAARIAATLRWPRVGPVRPEGVQTLAGWSLMRPLLEDQHPHVHSFLVLRSPEGVALWAARSADQAGGPGAPQLSEVWSRQTKENVEVTLIKQTADGAFLHLSGPEGVRIERVGPDPDSRAWASKPLREVFPPDETTRGMRRVQGAMADNFVSPQDGVTSPAGLVYTMDERTLVLTERSGRAAAFDADTGELLWVARTGVSRVYDAQLAYGTLVLAGDAEAQSPDDGGVALVPAIEVLDARTGRSGQRIGDKGGQVRWVRLVDSNTLICGLASAVVAIDLASAQTIWAIEDEQILPTVDAWLFGDRLVMLAPDRTLWLASATTGRMQQSPLDAPRSHLEATRSVRAYAVAPTFNSPFAFATNLGLMVFSPEGTLQGADGLGALDHMIPARPAADRAVTVEIVQDGRSPDGLMAYSLHQLQSATGMLADTRQILLGARPTDLVLLDGRVAISAGAVTVVLQAPPEN